MKVAIAVGGGGHFSPALAVINEMPKDWEILLIGRKHAFEEDQTISLEYQTAERLGLPFASLQTGRLQRNFSAQSIKSLLKVPGGIIHATKLLKDFKPDIVLSFGGYVAIPVALAAKAMNIPIVIHEQTLDAGVANKVVSKFADVVCISWESSAKHFPKNKIALTGNPLRKEFIETVENLASRSDHTKKTYPLLYITGGSGGAHAINYLVEQSLPKLLKKYRIIHQTGDAKAYGDFARLEAAQAQLDDEMQKRYLPKKFIPSDKVAEILSEADLVISRSGINTVTELLYLGKPSLLIPLPHGQKDEQKTNAQFLESVGLGRMYEQADLTAETFIEAVDTMIGSLSEYHHHAEKAREIVPTDATDKIIRLLITLHEATKR